MRGISTGRSVSLRPNSAQASACNTKNPDSNKTNMIPKNKIIISPYHSDLEKSHEISRALSTTASMNRILEKAETPKLSYFHIDETEVNRAIQEIENIFNAKVVHINFYETPKLSYRQKLSYKVIQRKKKTPTPFTKNRTIKTSVVQP